MTSNLRCSPARLPGVIPPRKGSRRRRLPRLALWVGVAVGLAGSALGQGPSQVTLDQAIDLALAHNHALKALRTQVQTDPHSPGYWRVNGTLSTLPEFQQAFGCRAGERMVRAPDQRARIW